MPEHLPDACDTPPVPLKRLYLLVHPFYKLDGRVNDGEHATKLALGGKYRDLAATLGEGEAMVAFPTAVDTRKPDVAALIGDLSSSLRERFLEVVDGDMGIVKGAAEGAVAFAGIREELRRRGIPIGPYTEIIAIGETAPYCVPRVADHARQALGTLPDALVLLDHTDWGHDMTASGNGAAYTELAREIARDHPGLKAK